MKDNYCTIYLVRHGESVANVSNIIGGNTSLTENGKSQAVVLGEKFRNINFSAVFSSNLLRARETAQFIMQGREFELKVHEGLRERSFGSIDKDKDEEYKHLFQALKDMSDEDFWEWKIVDDMESAQEAFGRFSKALSEIAKTYLGKKVLIVSHGTVIRSLLVHLGYGTFRELPTNSVTNTAYVILETDGENFEIKDTSGVRKLSGLSF